MTSKEGIKIRVLDFSNHLLQLKSVSEVVSALEAVVKENGGQLDLKSPQMSGLVDGLASQTLSTVTSCSSVLSMALVKGWLDLPSLLSVLVSQAASICHYPIAIDAIAKALLWEAKILQVQQQSYTCPYSLRINVHPFISLLNYRPESGWYVLSQLKQLCQALDSPSASLKVIEPFIKYVLLHPTPTAELSHFGCHLEAELISLASSSLSSFCRSREQVQSTPETLTALQRSEAITNLLVKLLPLQPTKSDQQLMFVTSMLEKVVQLVMDIQLIDDSGEHFKQDQDELIDMCFSLLCELTERGFTSQTLFEHLSSLLQRKKQQCAPHHWLALGWLVIRNLLNPQSIMCLLELSTLLLSKPTDSASLSSSANLLVYPLVQLLAQPSSALLPFASHDIISSNQKTASTLLKHQVEGCPSDQLFATDVDVSLSCSNTYTKLISTLKSFVEVDTQTLDEITACLSLEQSVSPGSNSNTVLALSALAMVVVRGEDMDLVKGVLSALTAVANCDPSESPSILSFFLYLQSLAQNPHFKLSILYSIPSLATHKLATISIVSTVQALGTSPPLLPLATRLMGRVWQRQDYTFPFLNELISRPLALSLPPRLVDEVTLARAIVIRDICQMRAEVHGEQMLSHISKFLLNSTTNPLPAAMVIEGLVALCHSEVTDVATLWGVLGGSHHSQWKLVNDGRATVVIALCQLFELASEVDPDTRHANKVFKVTALKYLWNCVQSKDSKICSAAFRSLSKFQLEDYFPEHMPPKLATVIGVAIPSDTDTSIPLCGRDCVQLVNHIPLESVRAYGHFLTNLIKAELKEIQRGVIYSALREVQLPSPTEKTLQSVKEVLSSVCSANLAKDVSSVGLIKGAMMMEYAVVKEKNGRIGRQALSKELQQRQAMLEAFFREGTLFSDVDGGDKCGWMGLSCLCAVKQWKTFTGKLLDTYAQLRLLETHTVLVEEESNDPIYLRKKREAFHWSVTQVLEKLHTFTRGNADSAPNILLALIGVVGTITSHKCSGRADKNAFCSMDLVDGFTAVLSGKQLPASSSTATVVQTLLDSTDHSNIISVVILCLPELVDSVIALYWEELDETVLFKLASLLDSLFEHFHGNPQWYIAVVLNQVLLKSLPVVGRLTEVRTKMTPFLEVSAQSDSLELLSLMSGLLPSLLLCGSHSDLAKSVLDALQQKLSSLADSAQLSNVSVQLCSLHLANGAVSLYSTGELSDEEVLQIITVLAELASKAPEAVLLHFSLSISLYGLGAHGCQRALSLADKIAAKWFQEAKELLTLEEDNQVLPKLFGLSGFLGVNPLLDMESSVVIPINLPFIKTLAPLVFDLLQKFVSHQDDIICSSSVWLLSLTHLTVSHVVKRIEKVPENYSYLPEDSVLNNLFLAMESLSSPPLQPIKVEIVKHLLTSLLSCGEPQLPPANFSSFLVPVLTVRGKLEQKIVEFLVKCKSTQGLRQLARYCSAPLTFSSLQMDSMCVLLENMAILLVSLPLKHFTKFAQAAAHVSLGHLQEHNQDLVLKSLMTGFIHAHTSEEVTYEAKRRLSAIVVRLFCDLCGMCEATTASVNLDSSILEKLATCLSYCDPAQASLHCQLTRDGPVSPASCISSIMHCCWVKAGVRNIKTLYAVMEWLLSNADDNRVVSPLSWLLQTTTECCSAISKSSEVNQNNFMQIISSRVKAAKVVNSCHVDILLLLLGVVCGASNVAIKPHLHFTTATSSDNGEKLGKLVSAQSQLCELPSSKSIREKICLFLLELIQRLPASKHKLTGTILSLKSTEQFTSPVIWTSIAQWW